MVHLKLGYACNNACRFCPYGDLRAREPAYPRGALEEALVVARRAGDAISLSGGEVTLRRDLAEIVLRARAAGFARVQIQTNGRMLAYRSLARALAEAGVDEAVVLLLGPDAAVHDFLTDTPGSFAQTVAGIRNAVAEGIAVDVRTILARSNFRHLAAHVALCADLGARSLRFVFPAAVAAAELPTIVPRLELLADVLPTAVEQGRRRGLAVESEGFPRCFAHAPAAAPLHGKGDPIPDGAYVKGPACERCALAPECPGLERAYAERYGFSELRPT